MYPINNTTIGIEQPSLGYFSQLFVGGREITGSGGLAFGTIAVAGQSNIVADTDSDTLTIVAGTNITLTTNAATDTLTINAAASGGITLGTPQTASSTAVDFTGIPASKSISILLSGISTNGTSPIIIQIGGSGGVEISGYLGTYAQISGPSASSSNSTGGVLIFNSPTATSIIHGKIDIKLIDISTNLYSITAILGTSDINLATYAAYSKSLTSILDRIRLTTLGGVNTFDAGVINIQYE